MVPADTFHFIYNVYGMGGRWVRSVSWLCTGAVLFLCASCGGSGSASLDFGGTASIRVLNGAEPPGAVSVTIGTSVISQSLSIGAATPYATVLSGPEEVQMAAAGGALSDVIENLNSGHYYTLIGIGGGASSQDPNNFIKIDDSALPAAPASGTTLVRFIHAFAPLGSVDLYVVPTGTSIAKMQPLVAGLTYRQYTGWASTTTSAVDIIATNAGSKTIVVQATDVPLISATLLTTTLVEDAVDQPAFSINSP